eukprot:4634706-Pyramimonas_sp.AAC.1
MGQKTSRRRAGTGPEVRRRDFCSAGPPEASAHSRERAPRPEPLLGAAAAPRGQGRASGSRARRRRGPPGGRTRRAATRLDFLV